MDPLTTPPPFDIPAATVQRWMAIEPTVEINAPLRRADLDNLFFAIDNLNRGAQNLQKALVSYSNSQLDEANAANAASTQNLVEAANRLRMFMNAIMASASASE